MLIHRQYSLHIEILRFELNDCDTVMCYAYKFLVRKQKLWENNQRNVNKYAIKIEELLKFYTESVKKKIENLS